MSPPAVDSFVQLASRRLLDLTLTAERQLAAERAAIARGEDPGRTPPEEIRDQLQAELERQKIDARPAGYEPELALFRQAQHVMVVTVDGILDSVPWAGGASWPALGVLYPPPDGVALEIDDQIEQLLEEEEPSADLVQLYLLALAVLSESPSPELSSESILAGSDRLLELLAGQLPEVGAEPDHLFPAAYRRQQLRGRGQAIADPKPWLIALLVVTVLLLLTSVPLWWDGTDQIRDAIDRIREYYRG